MRQGTDREGNGDALEVSVVIPCLNEEESIGGVVASARAALAALGVASEVVVADNGSSDSSVALATAQGARVIHVAPRGYGAAVREGIAQSRGRLIVLGDADGQHDFGELGRFVERLRAGDDLVVGNRFGREIARGAMSFTHRYIGNPLLSGLSRLLSRSGIHDSQCGMRALTRDAFEQIDLRTSGFELCPEMVMKAARAHLRISEVDITVRPELRSGPAHLRTIPDGFRHLMYVLMCSPNWLFVAPGLLLMSIGVALVSWLFVGPQHLGGLSLDTRTELFGILLASIGFDIASIGIFARVYSYTEPRRAKVHSLERFLRALRLEEGLALGGLLVLVGVVGGLVDLLAWQRHGFGIIQNDRGVIFWALWFVLGVQVSFSSIFLSMLGISRRTWLGDAE